MPEDPEETAFTEKCKKEKREYQLKEGEILEGQ